MHPLLDRDDGMVWYGMVWYGGRNLGRTEEGLRWEEFRDVKDGMYGGQKVRQ